MIWLNHVQIPGAGFKNIGIRDGKIAAISECKPASSERPTPDRAPASSSHTIPHDRESCAPFHFDDCLAFPGLINSHDHLHFNLFPPLGNRIYANYVDWGRDIHAVNRDEIEAVLKIPKALRTQWGIYKNLLNGVTTVVHHGEYLPIAEPPLTVFQDCHALHSVKQEPYWRLKLNRPYVEPWPYVIHAGEGSDSAAHREIETLLRWNLFKRKLIAVHGVAMTEAQARSFGALIWCPASNFFLLNKTADVARLGEQTPIVFGTDSTLTASWNLWEQLRFARSLGLMPDEALFRAVTQTPAGVWKMGEKGQLREGFQADVVVASKRSNQEGYAPFFELNPVDIVLVMHRGRVVLCDEIRYRQTAEARLDCDLNRVSFGNSVKYVAGDLTGLIGEINRLAPGLACVRLTQDA